MDGLLLRCKQQDPCPLWPRLHLGGKANDHGHKETDAAKLFLQHYKIPMSPEAYLTQRKRILVELYPYCKPLPGVMKLVRHLKEHNVPICVATSSTRDAFIMKSSKNEELF
ncbi:hypothetical protein BCR33DRAFT_720843 [Rhizoclosmatium globosum]|uniref:HAD-like protein n=1 Tax=Rhizoclosmatium globosum TaxID=329046 RepID=A0A1Y2BTQ6_9FUNG|nr:hypothetical protein BCR33DRAFT_720843 [Rhizoclosmatium globosum]|eukprot:ORY38129.1 hypothetical protein BCR33DRAFT_720843 [Rhizoclosmatium globosum]